MQQEESKTEIRSFAFGGMLLTFFMIAYYHIWISELFYELEIDVDNFILTKIIDKNIYALRAVFVFCSAYGSMSTMQAFRQPKPHGIYFFILGSAMLLYGYFDNLLWYNAFIYPITPFVVMLNAKHLPVLNFKRKTLESFYNNYQKVYKPGGIIYPLDKKRTKSKTELPIDLSKPLVELEPGETTLFEAGTGKGKSRAGLAHYITSLVNMGCSIVIHDFKGNPNNPDHPELTKFALDAIRKQKKYNYQVNMTNFTNPLYSNRVNVYDPAIILDEQDIKGVNQSIMYSLNKSWAKESSSTDPFWKSNTIALLDGVALTVKKYRPDLLTLPHLVAITIRDTDSITDAFLNVPDAYLRTQFQAFRNSYDLAKETAGSIISSTQIPLVAFNDSKMFWVLSGLKEHEDYFSLNLNSDDPFILSICNNDDKPNHTHGVNTYLKTTLNRLKSKTKRPIGLVVDELDQIYIDGLDKAISVVRSAGTKIALVVQTYKQLEDKMGRAYADKIYDLAQNKIFGGGSSPDSVKRFVENYVPKYQDLELSVGESSGQSENFNQRTQDKKVVDVDDILTQEKFHFSGIFSTGQPNLFYNLPFKVNPLKMDELELPIISQMLNKKRSQFGDMTIINDEMEEVKVDSDQADSAYQGYIDQMLNDNRARIFKEADEFIEDLKNGKI